MLTKILVVVALSSVAVFALADESDARREAKQVIELQDGAIVYVFENGKMAYQDKYGKAVNMKKKDTVLTTKDGKNITMVGNEVARLRGLLALKH